MPGHITAKDAGAYLFEEFNRYQKVYSRLVFIRSGLEPSNAFVNAAKAESLSKKWGFGVVEGSLHLFRRLLAGDWTDEFLVVPPQHEVIPTYNERLVDASTYLAGNSGREKASVP